MKTTVGVYDTKDEIVDAINMLKENGFPSKKMSVLGRVTIEDADLQADEKLFDKAGKRVGISALVGSTIGILSGVGIFAIPGLGFIFGAGALVGAIAGFDLGLIGGGLISGLSLANVHGDIAEKYEDKIREGKFLLIVQGSEEELKKALEVIHKHGKHLDVNTH